MAHAQKPDLVFQRNGRVHLYRRGCQFSRLLAAEVCASAVVMLHRPCSDTVQDSWLPTLFASFPFTSPPVLRRVPPDSVSTLLMNEYYIIFIIYYSSDSPSSLITQSLSVTQSLSSAAVRLYHWQLNGHFTHSALV